MQLFLLYPILEEGNGEILIDVPSAKFLIDRLNDFVGDNEKQCDFCKKTGANESWTLF